MISNSTIRLIIAVLFVFFSTNVGIGQDRQTDFVEYVSKNKTVMKLDEAAFADKPFSIKIPNSLKQVTNEMSGCFIHTLNFENEAKIVLIYIPNRTDGNEYNMNRLSLAAFTNLCKREKISEDLNNKTLMRRRYFGLNKLLQGTIFVMYLNVRKSDVKAFEYSVKSVQLD